MPELRIQLLGGLQVRGTAGRDIRLPSRKAAAVLACLALQPGVPVRRDFLANLLWDDSDPELARSSLRQALAGLRRALGEEGERSLRADAAAVALDDACVTTDLEQCRELLRAGSPDAIASVVDRHAGVLLEGFDARSAAFEQWLEERRSEHRRELLRVMERAAAHCAAAGDLAGATIVLSRLVALEPTNERAQRDLMEGYARLGRPTDAVRQYRECREALRRDLDVAPEPATEALYRDILRRRRRGGLAAAVDVLAGEGFDAGAAKPATEAVTLREAVVLAVHVEPHSRRVREDPEAAREFWSALHAEFRATTRRYGGLAADATGPSVPIAVFGLNGLTGLEADRAARAALELTASDGDRAQDRRLAVGMARGLVLPASRIQSFPLSGAAVPEAEALARAAGPGSVVVSEDLALQLGDRYVLDRGPGTASGSARTLRAGREPPEAPTAEVLVGRGPELAMLVALLERVVSGRRGRTVRVRGEPGIGKSAVLAALASQARAAGFGTHAVAALDFGQAARERPLPALAAKLLRLPADASDDGMQGALQAAVADGRLPPGELLATVDLLGIAPTAEQVSLLAALGDAARERSRGAVLRGLVARAAAERPLLLVVEDTHWAGPEQNGLLADLAAAIATQPVLLALSSRIDDDTLGPAWRARARGCPVATIDLATLAEDEAREMAARYPGIEPTVREQCLQVAAGHPFFLDQLLRAAQSGQVALPGSVRALLLARVERLAPDCRRVLQAAAVLGMRFHHEALRHLLADPVCDPGVLEQEGLLRIDGEETAFAHSLIRKVVYESLLRSHRCDLHRRAALWFEERDPVLHAAHLASAEAPEAAEAYLRAASGELSTSRLDRALACVESARELATSAAVQCRVATLLGEVNLARGHTESAIGAFRTANDLAVTPADRCRAWLGLAAALRVIDRYDEALEALREAELAAVAEADPRQLARLWALRGNVHFPRGELDACLAAHERALEFATLGGAPEDVARAQGGLGDAQYQRGRMLTALEHFQRCVDLCDRHGLAGPRLAYLPMLAASRAYAGEFDAAEASARQAAATARRVGEVKAELLACSVHASLEVYRGHPAAAIALAQRTLEAARQLGARRFECEGLLLIGVAELASGRAEEGRKTLEQAVNLSRVAAPTYCGPWALAALALATPEVRRARQLLDEGQELLGRGCVSHNHLEFHHYAIDVSLRTGDPAAAHRHADALADYVRDEPLPWASVIVARARMLAASAAGERPAGNALRTLREEIRRMQFDYLLPALDRAFT